MSKKCLASSKVLSEKQPTRTYCVNVNKHSLHSVWVTIMHRVWVHFLPHEILQSWLFKTLQIVYCLHSCLLASGLPYHSLHFLMHYFFQLFMTKMKTIVWLPCLSDFRGSSEILEIFLWRWILQSIAKSHGGLASGCQDIDEQSDWTTRIFLTPRSKWGQKIPP